MEKGIILIELYIEFSEEFRGIRQALVTKMTKQCFLQRKQERLKRILNKIFLIGLLETNVL